ncbi:MAG: hypothetical protein ACKV2V_30105 [Blastocatellia bacterium]
MSEESIPDNETAAPRADRTQEQMQAAGQSAAEALAAYAEHVQISGVIIASLASTIGEHLGEDKLKVVVQSEAWQMYMASKRGLEDARNKVATLRAFLASGEQPPSAP